MVRVLLSQILRPQLPAVKDFRQSIAISFFDNRRGIHAELLFLFHWVGNYRIDFLSKEALDLLDLALGAGLGVVDD